MLKRVLPFSITLIVGAMLGNVTNSVDVHRRMAAGVSLEQHQNHSRTWVIVRSLPVIIYTGEYSQDVPVPFTRLRVLLGADGTVSKIESITMQPHVLPEEVISAASKFEFTPATKDGEPISVWLYIEYRLYPGYISYLSPTIISAWSEAGEPWRVIHE